MSTSWRKSSYSHDVGTDCIEVAFRETARVRDSKNATGPVLGFGERAWRGFVRSLHA
jgi:hypothetical protein